MFFIVGQDKLTGQQFIRIPYTLHREAYLSRRSEATILYLPGILPVLNGVCTTLGINSN
jgi:hypothetical protein